MEVGRGILNGVGVGGGGGGVGAGANTGITLFEHQFSCLSMASGQFVMDAHSLCRCNT